MILIMGSSRDDLLYYESVIKNKHDGIMILNKYPAMTGTIFNQNVILIRGIYTSYVSSAVMSYAIREYHPVLAIMVGKCRSISSMMKQGDIAISRNIICIDTNQALIQPVKYGQVPGFDQSINQSVDILNTMNETFDKLGSLYHRECTYICSNSLILNKEQMSQYYHDDQILNVQGFVVNDSESGGAAIACNLYGIPFICVKVVETTYEKEPKLDDYIKVIGKYSNVGKAIISFIGEIGRNDTVTE